MKKKIIIGVLGVITILSIVEAGDLEAQKCEEVKIAKCYSEGYREGFKKGYEFAKNYFSWNIAFLKELKQDTKLFRKIRPYGEAIIVKNAKGEEKKIYCFVPTKIPQGILSLLKESEKHKNLALERYILVSSVKTLPKETIGFAIYVLQRNGFSPRLVGNYIIWASEEKESEINEDKKQIKQIFNKYRININPIVVNTDEFSNISFLLEYESAY